MKKIFAIFVLVCTLVLFFIFPSNISSPLLSTNDKSYTLISLDEGRITFKQKEESLSNNYNKPYLLIFMTSWCSYCVSQAKHIANINADFGDEINIYGVFADKNENIEELNQFVLDSNTKFPWFYKGDISKLVDSYSINTFPFFLLYDKNGSLFMSYDGLTPEEMIAFDIKRLLKE